MKTRQEIKAAAKVAIANQRSTSILLYLVYMVIVGVIVAIQLIIPGVVGALIYLAAMLVSLVMGVGFYNAYRKIYIGEQTQLGELFMGYNNFGRNFMGVLWFIIFFYLWSLLLIIPGIIKGISYSAVFFILGESQKVNFRQALKLSMKITKGHKSKIFVLILSFIGWGLLSILTLGILWIVYAGPYFAASFGGLYVEMRDAALESGVITQEELA